MNYAQHIASFSDGKTTRIVDEHTTDDIVQLMMHDDGVYIYQVRDFTNSIENLPYKSQCLAIWNLLIQNVQYDPDSAYLQELQIPAALFRSGRGDCKSFSLYIATCLRALNIQYEYDFISQTPNPTPTHVYVTALGKPPFVMDRVVGKFNVEAPYTFKYKEVMPLNRLTGLNEPSELGSFGSWWTKHVTHALTVNTQNLQKSAKVNAENLNKSTQQFAKNAGKTLDKVWEVVKKVFPADVLVRSGILGILWIDMFKSASKLSLGLLSPAVAQARGYDMTEWNKLHTTVQNFINNFVAGGGDRANIENAIKHGAGNPSLNGLGMGCNCPHLGEEPITAAAGIAAATPIVLAVLKSIESNIDKNKLTAGAKNSGSAEANFLAPSTVTPAQLQQIQQGTNALAQDSGLSHPFGNGLPGSFKSLLTPKNLLIGAAVVGVGYYALQDE